MSYKFTAIYKKSGEWYLGWVEEIPGVNTQGKTLKEAKENSKEALFINIGDQSVNQPKRCEWQSYKRVAFG